MRSLTQGTTIHPRVEVAKAPGLGWTAWGSVPHGSVAAQQESWPQGPVRVLCRQGWGGVGWKGPFPAPLPACALLSPNRLPSGLAGAGSGLSCTRHISPVTGVSPRLREPFLMNKHSGARVPLLLPCSMSAGPTAPHQPHSRKGTDGHTGLPSSPFSIVRAQAGPLTSLSFAFLFC